MRTQFTSQHVLAAPGLDPLRVQPLRECRSGSGRRRRTGRWRKASASASSGLTTCLPPCPPGTRRASRRPCLTTWKPNGAHAAARAASLLGALALAAHGALADDVLLVLLKPPCMRSSGRPPGVSSKSCRRRRAAPPAAPADLDVLLVAASRERRHRSEQIRVSARPGSMSPSGGHGCPGRECRKPPLMPASSYSATIGRPRPGPSPGRPPAARPDWSRVPPGPRC